MLERRDVSDPATLMRERAESISKAGNISQLLKEGTLPARIETSLSEALILGLLKQGVTQYYAIFGHGSTDLGEVMRIYAEAGAITVINCRNEVEMAHAATAYAWQYKRTPAVITSIGPGSLQAMAGSLAAASNGIGVYHIYGDETTRGEGYNMQQVPKPEQGLFGRITALMGESYTLHTPEALRECMRRGTACVHHPYKAGPFYILLPINTQPQITSVNLGTLPERMEIAPVAPVDEAVYDEAVKLIGSYEKIVIKAGGGTRAHAEAVRKLAEAAGAAVVLSPGSTGVLPDAHPQNMHVGGSKGSISGNYAMSNAELVIFIGSRGVCQADCSGIGYPNAKAVININGDIDDVSHYANTLALHGDITAVVNRLLPLIEQNQKTTINTWLPACAEKKAEWSAWKQSRTSAAPIMDDAWKRPVLTQPAAIQTVASFAKRVGATKFFDAGDVQANGFQLVEDDQVGETYTETGASYMGFATSALLGSAGVKNAQYGIAFTGDGSFMMNPQVLIDAVEHGVKGMIALFDNRRMAAITSLQYAQYGVEFRTNDSVPVDYVQLAGAVSGVKAIWGGTTQEELEAALAEAHAHDGLSLVHIPVYAGREHIAEMGAYGNWNVGNWVDDVQARYLEQNI